jgi:hypothetical protein
MLHREGLWIAALWNTVKKRGARLHSLRRTTASRITGLEGPEGGLQASNATVRQMTVVRGVRVVWGAWLDACVIVRLVWCKQIAQNGQASQHHQAWSLSV